MGKILDLDDPSSVSLHDQLSNYRIRELEAIGEVDSGLLKSSMDQIERNWPAIELQAGLDTYFWGLYYERCEQELREREELAWTTLISRSPRPFKVC